MGNSSSSSSKVFSNALHLRETNPFYIIYESETRIHHITISDDSDEEIIFVITEVIPEDSSKDNTTVFIDKETGKSYTPIEDDIIEKAPCFSVTPFSEMIYLDHLYATRTRSGRFYEELITTIGKDIGAEGVYLEDASKGGKCEDFSLSIQLFISEEKQFQTYYELLGYTNTDIRANIDKTKLIYLLDYTKDISVSMIIESMKSSLDNKDVYVIYSILKENGDHSLPLIKYLNELVITGKCTELSLLLSNVNPMLGYISRYFEIFYLLSRLSRGNYVKYFEN